MSSFSTGNQVTSDNVGPAINVVTWFLAATALLAVVARIVTKQLLSRLWIDDVFILAALAASIGMSITVGFETKNGLGQHIDRLSSDQLIGFQKASYSGDVLYVLVLCLSKISILWFFELLTPVKSHWISTRTFMGVVALWGTANFFSCIFQCRLPDVWTVLSPDRCFDGQAFMAYVIISNLAFEVAVVAFPITVVSRLQAKSSRKMLLISCFAARSLVIVAQIAELVIRFRFVKEGDLTFNLWPVTICCQLVQSLSIITACIPYLKTFLSSLQTGMIRTDDIRRRTGNKNGIFCGSVPNGLKVDIGQANAVRSEHMSLKSPTLSCSIAANSLKPTNYGETRTVIEAAGKKSQWDTQSCSSKTMIINKATEWEVQTEQRTEISERCTSPFNESI